MIPSRRGRVPRREGGRLSTEEVAKRLRRARELFNRWDFLAGSATHTSQDFQNLDLITHDEQVEAIRAVLDEIKEVDYAGPNPPKHLSGEPKCQGERMLQFVWHSCRFGDKQMCVKFCLVENRFVLLRLHEAYNPNAYEG